MRCNDFDDLAYDLSRDGLMDAAARSDALSHAASCRFCAARLAAERHLNEVLALAAAETEGAPSSLKLALLEAFPSRESGDPERFAPGARRTRWYVAAAVAVLAILLVVSLRVVVRRSIVPPTQRTPAGEEASQATTLQQARPGSTPTPAGGGGQPPRRLPGTRRHRHYVAKDSVPTVDPNAASSESNALTDFIPLTHLSASTAIASGQVIRVRVPLSAFISLGLPVSPEHAAEFVNAELVVGDDGVQRAVRLVR